MFVFRRCRSLKLVNALAILAIAIAVIVIAAIFSSQLSAQETRAPLMLQDLIGDSVSDIGPQFDDVRDAVARFYKNDFNASRALLESAKRKQPKLPPPEVMMAKLLASVNQPGAARGELEKAVIEYPNDPEAYLIFGDVAFQERQVTDAELLFSKAEQLAQKYDENAKRKRNFEIRSQAGLAAVAEQREQWQSAFDRLSTWLKMDPESAPAHQRMGQVLFKLGKAKEAYKEFQEAARLDPKTGSPEIFMGRLYQQAEDPTMAEKMMKLAIQNAPKDVSVHLGAAQWAVQVSKYNDAAQYTDTALKLDPKSLEAKIMRGLIARLMGDSKGAEAQLNSAYSQSPGNFLTSNQLALALAEQNDPAKRKRALELAEVNARQFPRNPEAATTLAWIYFQLGRLDEADRLLGAVVQASQGSLSPDSAYYVARVLEKRNKAEDAKQILKSALQTTQPFAHRKDAQDLLARLNQSSSGSASKSTEE